LAPESLARLGRAAMTPLEVGEAVNDDKFGNPPTPLSPQPTSFLTVDNPNLVVVNWKVADDKQGTILRLLEVGGASGMAHLNFDVFTLQRAWTDNAAEANQKELQVSQHTVEVPFKPHEILTVRIVATGISQ
jgi:alpha-mannosidase